MRSIIGLNMLSDVIILKASIDDKMHESVRNLIGNCRANECDTIFIVLETGGGDPMYAYRTMKLVNSFYRHIYCIVPDMSMSAGTLMTLGSDKIYMHSDSCLGPLDLQIPHPNDDTRISTLDIKDTASSTTMEAAMIQRKIFLENLKTGMPKTLAEKMTSTIVSAMYAPIMNKIDPYHMHESIRNAELSTIYGTRLLLMRMTKGDLNKAIGISTHLANNYTYHGYAITMDEAIEIGLQVDAIESLPEWSQIKVKYEATQNGNINMFNMNDNRAIIAKQPTNGSKK